MVYTNTQRRIIIHSINLQTIIQLYLRTNVYFKIQVLVIVIEYRLNSKIINAKYKIFIYNSQNDKLNSGSSYITKF